MINTMSRKLLEPRYLRAVRSNMVGNLDFPNQFL